MYICLHEWILKCTQKRQLIFKNTKSKPPDTDDSYHSSRLLLVFGSDSVQQRQSCQSTVLHPIGWGFPSRVGSSLCQCTDWAMKPKPQPWHTHAPIRDSHSENAGLGLVPTSVGQSEVPPIALSSSSSSCSVSTGCSSPARTKRSHWLWFLYCVF